MMSNQNSLAPHNYITNDHSSMSAQNTTNGSNSNSSALNNVKSGSLSRSNIPPASIKSTPTSLKELKRDYHIKKKHFTKNVQSAIESTQEIHSGWLKAKTTFKRWTKVWCQVKPGYLILYTSQEALKRHRLGVVLLAVCQVIKRPTRKEGFCFKLINPLGCSVWAKSSTKALVFAQASLTLRVSDSSIGKLWLDALNRCNLSANLDGYSSIIDDRNSLYNGESTNGFNRSGEFSDSDADEQSTHLMINQSHTTSENTSMSSYRNQNNGKPGSGQPFLNGRSTPLRDDLPNKGSSTRGYAYERLNDYCEQNRNLKSSSQLERLNNNNNDYEVDYSSPPSQTRDLKANSSSKMVAKFSKYNWKELQLENVAYIGDEIEELGTAGIQSEEVQEGNKNFLWHIIKQLRPGMDLSKVTLPTFILEPRSFLEKLADYYYHCDILSDAVLIDDPLMRLINIVKWYLSGFYKKPKGPKKPYNPILGERFRCFWDHPKTQSRTFFIAEQVSHHPPISAFHVSNRKDGYTITCALLSKSKYGGNSVSAILDGTARLHLTKRNETYTLTMPYANCRGILLGSLCLELGGKVDIECVQTGCKCELDFKIASMWANSNSYNTLTGKILSGDKVTHTLDGYWDKKINIVDKRTEQKSVLWEVTDTIRNSRLKRYTVDLKDQHERESVKLWSKVTEALVSDNQVMATTEKTKLEDMQRLEARERVGVFNPQHFELKTELNSSGWTYKWQDDRPWDSRRDIMQFEDNFKIKTLMLDQTTPSSSIDPRVDTPVTSMSKLADEFKSQMNQFESNQPGENEPGPSGTRNKTNTVAEPLGHDTFKTIESKIAAGNQFFEEALRQVNEKNKRLEEDIALLKRARGKRTLALIMTAIIVATLGIIFRFLS